MMKGTYSKCNNTCQNVADYEKSIQDIKPELICAGQLVELQVSFRSMKAHKGEVTFVRRLNSVCILDRTYQLVRKTDQGPSLTHTRQERLKPPSTKLIQQHNGATLKRKMGYNDDEKMSKRKKTQQGARNQTTGEDMDVA
jgi:hypothetical protein